MISDSVRAQVIAHLLNGGTVSDAARKFHLAKSTVSALRKSFSERNRTGDEIEIEQSPEQIERLSIDGLVAESLRRQLKMQNAIADVGSDPEYLKKQTAEHLAKLLEVSQAHSIRLLEAASDAGIESED